MGCNKADRTGWKEMGWDGRTGWDKTGWMGWEEDRMEWDRAEKDWWGRVDDTGWDTMGGDGVRQCDSVGQDRMEEDGTERDGTWMGQDGQGEINGAGRN